MVDAVVLDERLAIGFSETTKWNTVVVTKSGGYEVRNARWSAPRRAYELPYAPLPIDDVKAIVSFFNDERGRHRTWLLHSFLDCTVDNEQAGVGDSSETDFQIIKKYGTVSPFYRDIVHVKSGTLSATVNDTPATITSETDGVVTLASPPGTGDIVRFSCEFYVPVRFDTDEIKVVPVLPAGTNPETSHALISDLTAIEVRA